MEFLDWLTKQMTTRGWSESDLAREADLTRGAINHLFSGRTKKPSPPTVEKLSKAFKIPYEEVMRIAGHLTPEESPKSARVRRIIEKSNRLESEKEFDAIEALIDAFLRHKK